MEHVRVLELWNGAIEPRLQVLEPRLEVAALGIVERAEVLAQPHGIAQAAGDELDGGVVR